MLDKNVVNKLGGGTIPSQKRDSNIELFRIITMLLIVAHHYVVNSGLNASDGPIQADPMSANSIFLLLLGAWGKTGINCFVMITGYFMCKSQITVKKFVKLVGEWLFFRYVIYAAFFITGYEAFSVRNVVMAIIPITSVNKGFVSCFMLFWLLIPFMNILIHNLSERQHLWLLGLLGVIYVLFGTIHQVTMNYISWFCVLYFLSAYVRLYPKKWMNRIKVCRILFLTSIILCKASVVCCIWLGVKLNRFIPYFFVTDSNTLLAVFCGFTGFLFFKNIHVPYSKLINTIAASTFGVLLIHAHSDTMRHWLWNELLDVTGHYSDKWMPLYSFFCIISIFIIGILIDQIRIHFFEKPFFKWWDKRWDGWSGQFALKEEAVLKKFNIK